MIWRIIILVLLLSSVQLHAASRTVRIDGNAVFSLAADDAADLEARVAKVERRLKLLLSRPESIGPAVIARGLEGELVLSVSGVKVVSITPEDAENNLVPPAELAEQWKRQLDTHLINAAERRRNLASRFFTEVRSNVESAFLRLAESGIAVVPGILAAVLVLLFVWALAAGARALMRLIFKLIIRDITVENLLKQVVYYSIWFLGFIVAADALGFDAQTVITGLGLTSLALGFALKDVLSNFVSGIVILLFRPFHLRDQIVVGTTEGTVERIDLRATQIRTYDGLLVLVPNQELMISRVINNTASDVRRGRIKLFLGYDTSLPQVWPVILKALQNTEGVLSDPPAKIRVSELGEADIEFEALFWTDSRRSDFVTTGALVRRNVLAALAEIGASLPDPARRVVTVEQRATESSQPVDSPFRP